MVGRTPEYLGKKIEPFEMKMAALLILIMPITVLGLTALATSTPAGTAAVLNNGPHGFSEILYAFTSQGNNNGSAFAGLSADTPLLDYGLATAMLFGRFAFLVPVLAIAGSLAAKPKLPPSAGTFPTTGPLFVGLLVGVIIILGGLQFMPADAICPLAEQYELLAGKTY
jgi:K+-transporting ATPase ATPase A chain